MNVKDKAKADYEANLKIMTELRGKIDEVLARAPAEVALAEVAPAEPEVLSTVNADIPDPTKHKYISFAKSAVRIAAGLALAGGGWLEMNPYLQYAGVLLVLAEVLGVAEELV